MKLFVNSPIIVVQTYSELFEVFSHYLTVFRNLLNIVTTMGRFYVDCATVTLVTTVTAVSVRRASTNNNAWLRGK